MEAKGDMSNTEMFYRRANVTRQDALAGLLARFPEADLLSFEKIQKDGHEVFAAELRLAEFPPKKDEGEEEPKDEAPAPDDGGGEEAPPDDGDGDDDAGGKPPFGGGDEGDAPEDVGMPGEEGAEHGEHHHKVTLDELANLLHQVLHAVAPGPDVAPGGPGADPGSLMDVGAPAQGDVIPPPPAPGDPAGGAALPPPVKHPRDQAGSPAFAAWKAHRSFDTIRDDAHELTNKQLIEEAHQVFAGYRVAKIDRQQMAEANRVVVAMVKATA